MVEFALLCGVIGAALLLGAWREYARDNRRDAGLLASFAAGSTVAGAALALA